jgi:hypothetical protein
MGPRATQCPLPGGPREASDGVVSDMLTVTRRTPPLLPLGLVGSFRDLSARNALLSIDKLVGLQADALCLIWVVAMAPPRVQ